MKMTIYLSLILTAIMPSLAKTQEPVYFADSNLKARIEATLKVNNPTASDMLGLTSLQVDSQGIKRCNRFGICHESYMAPGNGQSNQRPQSFGRFDEFG